MRLHPSFRIPLASKVSNAHSVEPKPDQRLAGYPKHTRPSTDQLAPSAQGRAWGPRRQPRLPIDSRNRTRFPGGAARPLGSQTARVPLPSVSRHHPYLDVFSRSPSSLPPGKPAIAPSALGIWEACLALWPEASCARTRRQGGEVGWGGGGELPRFNPEHPRNWLHLGPCLPVPGVNVNHLSRELSGAG